MKKTLTINLGGVVFHIDEDAYQALQQYLDKLKVCFSRQEGADEILNDIETRMAELLAEKLRDDRQVVTLDDIHEVTGIMGQPTEIDQEEDASNQNHFRPGDKGEKRFFRNPDEKIIGGVCSGIAAYFHLDPVWVRLLFVLFVVAGGSGILLYLILWFVIPEAKTTTDRLEMRGKRINIPNIEKSIRSELSALGGQIGQMANDSAASLKRAGRGSSAFFEGIRKGILEVAAFAWKGIQLLVGILLMITGIGLLIVLLAYTLGWSNGIYADNDFTVLTFPMLAKLTVGCNMRIFDLQLIILMALGIPLVMLFYNGLRMVFRFNRIKYLGLTMFNVWVIGVLFLAWSSMKIYHLYKYEEHRQIVIALEKPAADTLFVKLFPDDPGIKLLNQEQYNLVGDLRTVLAPDNAMNLIPKFRLEQSEDSLFSITQVTMANGKSKSEALQHLTSMRFQSATAGSTLKISPFLRIPPQECWRGQMIDLIIRIPKGKYVHFDQELQSLQPYWYCDTESESGSTYLMTENGVEMNPEAEKVNIDADTSSQQTRLK